MITSALPILMFVILAFLLAAALLSAGQLLGPRRLDNRVKQMPYESGMNPIHDTKRRFDVRFHLVAIAFLVFDVELLFLYPWAVASRNVDGLDAVVGPASQGGLVTSRGLVFVEVMIFLGLLALGFVYVWRKGVLRWR